MFELEEKKLTQQYELEKSKLEIEKLRAENGKVKLAAKVQTKPLKKLYSASPRIEKIGITVHLKEDQCMINKRWIIMKILKRN
ncbi:unnamed protein product [Rhizophagus irregularis]|nr:unnamed protein product [Rhizophagus irregularis]